MVLVLILHVTSVFYDMVHHALLGLHVISVLHAMSNQGLTVCLTCDVSIACDEQ